MKRLLLALAAATALSGCYSVTYQMDDLNHVKVPGETLRSFRFEVWNPHWLYGLITPSTPEIATRIVTEVLDAKGRFARNIRLTHQVTFLDGLLTGLTVGLYTPTTVVVEGDIVQ